MKVLVTGAGGFLGGYLARKLRATPMTHQNCELTDYPSVKNFDWEGNVIVHCANSGVYGQDEEGSVEKNLAMLVNLRRRWPNAKLITFGSGAMYDKSKPIVKAKESDYVLPSDLYGLYKRLSVNLSDVTLIPFGIYGPTRFIEAVKKDLDNVTIFQEVLFSWVNLSDLPQVVKWAVKHGQGAYNLCAYDMTLTQMAKHLGARKICYLKDGTGNEYTGKSSIIPLTLCPKD